MKFESNIPLNQFATCQIGGNAKFFIRVKSLEELIKAIIRARQENLNFKIIGGSSNLLPSDNGFDGLIIKNEIMGIKKISDLKYEFMSGELLDDVVWFTCENKLFGMECLSGIPGTTGGAVVQNAGAYGQEICDTIETLKVLNMQNLKTDMFNLEERHFKYRSTIFKNSSKYFILSSTHHFTKEKPIQYSFKGMEQFNSIEEIDLWEVRNWIINTRKEKSTFWDLNDKNSLTCGSFFTNPIVNRIILDNILKMGYNPSFWDVNNEQVKISAGWLIENSGYQKGYKYKSVGLSEKTCLSIVNLGNGKSQDVKMLASLIKRKVKQKFGVELQREVIYL